MAMAMALWMVGRVGSMDSVVVGTASRCGVLGFVVVASVVWGDGRRPWLYSLRGAGVSVEGKYSGPIVNLVSKA